jgi:predicted phosphodiesterase
MRTLLQRITYNNQNGNCLRIVVISDAHLGHINYSEKHIKSYLKENLNQPNTWLLTLGDMLECVVPADMKRFQVSQLVTSSDDADAYLDYQTAELVKLLEPHREQLLGMVLGNHELAIIKRYGHNPHRRVCDALNCEDLGYSFLMRLICGTETSNHSHSVVFYGHHGWGGNSRTAGGNLTKFSRAIESYWADVYLFGHSHDHVTRQIPRIYVDRKGKVQHRPALIANVGTFKRTLSHGMIPSWEESMGFPPRALGGVIIKIMMDPGKRERPVIKVE